MKASGLITRLACMFLMLWMVAAVHAGAQEAAEKETINPQLSPGQDAYMNQQAEVGLALVTKTLAEFPPQLPEPGERKLALHLLDVVLHDVYAASREPGRVFLTERLAATVETIETTTVNEGAMIWKLYNDGFVVRTPTVTLGFDLIRTPTYMRDAAADAPDVIDRLVAQCDVLFVSHIHGDHADPFIAQAFLDAGKPVVAPPDIWAGEAFHEKVTHLKREAHTMQKLDIQNGKLTLDLVIYPGHQQISATGTVDDNNSLIFTPEGMSFCHTGDQSWMDDFEWIDTVAEHHRVDVLMPNCWTADMPRMIKGLKPALVIPGHENEMGHGIDSRIPHWRTYAAAEGATAPVMVMAWGECYHYEAKK